MVTAHIVFHGHPFIRRPFPLLYPAAIELFNLLDF